MNKQQEMVREFMRTFGQECPDKPKIPLHEMQNFRSTLIDEEHDELMDGMRHHDVEQTADALADLLYVVYGTAVACGIDIEEIFAEVHRSNMSKMWSYREINAAKLFDSNPENINFKLTDVENKDPDNKCWLVTRADGKILKSPSWTPPNIKPLLEKQSKCVGKEA